MLKLTSTLLLSLLLLQSQAQSDSLLLKDIKTYQNELDAEYKNPATSPLDSADRVKFRRHEFYPADLKYRVVADFRRTPDELKFKMKTTGSKTPEYVKYGVADFQIDGKQYKLNIYQNVALSQTEQYKDALFLPFNDNTNGVDTYGGGRYIDLTIPSGNSLVIDFNKAYNPYCAYSHRYSCPVPPPENHLDAEIKAGIKLHEPHD
jgi:uncharacterized protein